ncbi:MAG: hypothetical protein PQJ46_11660 [Spirochaetales bacterium]|nr:hypothetical protein [Spirochaetales bacterium]
MNYTELVKLYKTDSFDDANIEIKKLLSPAPLEDIENLENIIPSRFHYTGPGKWTRIIKNYKSEKKSTEQKVL